MAKTSTFAQIVFCSLLTIGAASALTQGSSDDACIKNVKQIGTAFTMYAADADNRLPLRGPWMDSVKPYIKSEAAYHCPSVASDKYGYAYSAKVLGRNIRSLGRPAETPMIFDSTRLGRSEIATFLEALPTTGRHGGKNTIGYVDGHAAAVAPAN